MEGIIRCTRKYQANKLAAGIRVLKCAKVGPTCVSRDVSI